MTEVALKAAGLGYIPCIIIKKSKRKTLVKYRDGKMEWVENKLLLPVDDNDIAWKARILRLLRHEEKEG